MRTVRSASALLAALALSAAAGASISTYSFTSSFLFGYPPTPVDGVSRSSGNPVTITIAIDQSLTYAGAPDSIVTTPLSIPGGLSVDVGGGEVFSASNYSVQYYNSGPFRTTRDYSIVSTGTILRNGVPIAAGAGLIQVSFFSPYFAPPLPALPGLDMPRPSSWISEGFVRELSPPYGEMRWGQMTYVPSSPVAALGGLAAARRRR